MTAPRSLLLVCSGNTCRSPLAQALLGQLLPPGIRLGSAGLAAFPGDAATEGARRVAAEVGLDLSTHRARALTPYLVAEQDLILTMTEAQRRALIGRFPEAAMRTFAYGPYVGREGDIPDPYGGDLAVYRRAREHLKELGSLLAKQLTESTGFGTFGKE